MSILSCSKASLRGSQPFPDPAFSFQPHSSFPLCCWKLLVFVGLGFFFPFLALFQSSSGTRFLNTCMSRTVWWAVTMGWQSGEGLGSSWRGESFRLALVPERMLLLLPLNPSSFAGFLLKDPAMQTAQRAHTAGQTAACGSGQELTSQRATLA